MAHPVAVRTHAHTQTQQANFIIAPMLLAGGDAQLHSFHSHFLVHIRVLWHSGGSAVKHALPQLCNNTLPSTHAILNVRTLTSG